MAFIDLANRVNTIAISRLGDGAATLNGQSVPGVFDASYSEGTVGHIGMASSSPVFVLADTHVPAQVEGMPLVYQGQNFTVVAHKPDGTGMSILVLEVSA